MKCCPLKNAADRQGPEKSGGKGSFLLLHLGKGKYEFGHGV